MSQPHTFTAGGARRIVSTVRQAETSDLLASSSRNLPKSRLGPEAFVVARVTEVDSDDLALCSAVEQYWDSENNEMAELPNGRVWDGAEGNLSKVRSIDGSKAVVDQLITVGLKYGASGDYVWYIVPGGSKSFWAKITGNTSDGTNKWKYAWTEQERTSTGWQDLSGGRSGTTSTNFAINSIEANNDGTGIQGNSIDIDGTIFDDNSDLEIQAVQGDPVVRMYGDLLSDGSLVYTFQYVNAVDGECG